jgi:hypothetical protein
MKDVFAWVPLIWTSRIFVLVSLWGATLIVTLYLARFLRPSHLKRLVTADLPVFSKVGGEAEVMGQKLALSAELDTSRKVELVATQTKLLELQNVVRRLEARVGADPQPNAAHGGEHGKGTDAR